MNIINEKRKTKSEKQIRKGLLAILLLIVIITPFAFIGFSQHASAEWKYNEFEDNISVDFRPKLPNNYEPVNITIIGKSQQIIKGAQIHYTYYAFDVARSGGKVFSPIPENPYALFVVIPGYPGSTVVDFYIEAWDLQNAVMTSQNYSYTVQKNNSWKYPTFDENVDVSYSPHIPGPDDDVNIIITSRSEEVPIKNVEVKFMLKPPELPEQGEFINDNTYKQDDYTWESIIRDYPEGTGISFWVVAFDDYFTPITSSRYNYTVSIPEPEEGPVRTKLWINIKDKFNQSLVGVIVSIKNSTWSEEFKTNENGTVLTPWLREEHYVITITYYNHIETKEIDVHSEMKSTTVKFKLDKDKILSEQHGIEDFPKWYVWAAFTVVLLFLPLLFFSYTERRREEISKRRAEKIYRKMERKEDKEERPWDPILEPFRPILKLFDEEPKRIGLSQFLAFFVLGIAGTAWAPFYPGWLIIILGFAIGSVSFRFPYLALIVMSLFAIASTAYQSPEFGFVFLIFSLIILICAFFNWKFGYLVFLTVFISRLGILVFVPITAALLYSLFLGLSVIIVSGLFLSFVVTCGNLTNIGFLIGPPHKSAFIIFNKSPPSEFLPVHFVDALTSINSPNLELMNDIFRSNYTSMVPIIQIVVWTVAIYLIYFFTEKYSEKNFIQYLSLIIIPIAFIPVSAIASIAFFDYSFSGGLVILSVALIGVGLTAVLTSFTIVDFYPSIFKREMEKDIIGTRISQLMTLRRSSFKNVGGLDEIKRELKTSITVPLLRPKLARLYGVNPPKGVMLFGPPGCGKTLIMRALATELNVEMIGVKCSDIMSKWYGESEEMTARMFSVAKSRAPCILFLDEIDAVAKRRSFYSTDDVTPRLLSIMLNELDGMDESAGIMVVGATNMPELIDPALLRPGRFDKIIYIPPPDFEARKDIFKLYLKNKPLAHGVNYYELAGRTEGYSGADIENIVKEASMHAMRRTMESRRRAFITKKDFEDILKEIKPSVSKTMQKEFEKLGFDYSRKTEARKKKKRKPKKSFIRRVEEEEEDEEEAGVIEMDEGEISWEEEEEEKKAEPPVWDRYKPKPSKRTAKRRKTEEEDESVVFKPVEEEEEETDEEPEKEKGPYTEVWDQKDEDIEDDYWM